MCGAVLKRSAQAATQTAPMPRMQQPQPSRPPQAPQPMTPPPPPVPRQGMPVRGVRQVEYAGFWLRLVASIIDGIATNIVIYPLSFIVGIVIGKSGMGKGMAAGAGAFISFLMDFLYYTLMESSSNRATLGKMALGLAVTDLDGNQITFGQAAGRFFGKIISGIILGFGYLMAGFTEKKQALHDIMAGTLVVKK
jgi:uncharacterized RDD family membrane protein YckC